MAFKSEAQRAKFYALKEQGKVSQKTIDEFDSKTPKNIPDRVKAKKVLTIKEMHLKSKNKLGR
jgi:hypothetical protein